MLDIWEALPLCPRTLVFPQISVDKKVSWTKPISIWFDTNSHWIRFKYCDLMPMISLLYQLVMHVDDYRLQKKKAGSDNTTADRRWNIKLLSGIKLSLTSMWSNCCVNWVCFKHFYSVENESQIATSQNLRQRHSLACFSGVTR